MRNNAVLISKSQIKVEQAHSIKLVTQVIASLAQEKKNAVPENVTAGVEMELCFSQSMEHVEEAFQTIQWRYAAICVYVQPFLVCNKCTILPQNLTHPSSVKQDGSLRCKEGWIPLELNSPVFQGGSFLWSSFPAMASHLNSPP